MADEEGISLGTVVRGRAVHGSALDEAARLMPGVSGEVRLRLEREPFRAEGDHLEVSRYGRPFHPSAGDLVAGDVVEP
ncbi:MAG: hypothetical protein ACYCYA_01645 [Actinomycetes bacterium]